MNYNYIESLVIKSKDGDEESKEKLVNEFKPFIINLSKKTFIHGYEFQDIMNECYRILFKCVSYYKPNTHRFVAYATNGIKNSINDLIEKNLSRSHLEGSSTLVLENVENTLESGNLPVDHNLLKEVDLTLLRNALNKLTEEEHELINYVFFKNNPVKKYAALKGIPYSTVMYKKDFILDNIFMLFNVSLCGKNNA
ncbi:sigma-70 family RNA polymerase sigma factor [Clostridium sp. SM-530-WT-3G]|uniref:sigma-70 family RNA polymerase sigma factor n=1 Tax=Clostridium sp. SM-530-WT-3G TaxID=2725303 RepID=UPI00145DD876|nr:sigma-70 family RNA polymerase sigma factor [Clostridium sp. SM-530-WT-3G]NME83396.1 sigma-70 family RNA polymerase sigma factor [Clostridium sp. SM-530-WT-3G]